MPKILTLDDAREAVRHLRDLLEGHAFDTDLSREVRDGVLPRAAALLAASEFIYARRNEDIDAGLHARAVFEQAHDVASNAAEGLHIFGIVPRAKDGSR